MINNVITSEDIEEYMCVLKNIKKGQERVRLDLDNESMLNVVESIGISVEELKTEIAKRVEDYINKYIAKEPREIIIACHQPTNEYQEYRDIIKEVIELIDNTDGTVESIYESLEEYYDKIEEETGLEGAGYTFSMMWRELCALEGEKTNLELNKKRIIKEIKHVWEI